MSDPVQLSFADLALDWPLTPGSFWRARRAGYEAVVLDIGPGWVHYQRPDGADFRVLEVVFRSAFRHLKEPSPPPP